MLMLRVVVDGYMSIEIEGVSKCAGFCRRILCVFFKPGAQTPFGIG